MNSGEILTPLEVVKSKMQKPLFVPSGDTVDRRHIGSSNIVATHGASVRSLATLATSGKFSGNDPSLDGFFFVTPNMRSKSLRKHEVFDRLVEVNPGDESYNPFDVSIGYAESNSFEDGFDGGFVVAFNKGLLSESDVFDVGDDDINRVPELAVKPAPSLNSIFKVYPLDAPSKSEFDQLTR